MVSAGSLQRFFKNDDENLLIDTTLIKDAVLSRFVYMGVYLLSWQRCIRVRFDLRSGYSIFTKLPKSLYPSLQFIQRRIQDANKICCGAYVRAY